MKEAYTIADMVAGGLTTKAGDQLLSSGGMFFINTPDDKDITLSKFIKVAIPTTARQKGMQLYKGEAKADGTMDWIDPKPIPEAPLSDYLQKGKALFSSNCASCHREYKDATGPGLAYANERFDKLWLEHFVHNSAEMVANHDALSVYIYKSYNSTPMVAFPNLSGDDLSAILNYATYEARANGIGPEQIPDIKKAFDSCRKYCELTHVLEEARSRQVADNGTFSNIHYDTAVIWQFIADNGITIDDDSSNAPAVITHTEVPSEYYKVEVNAQGWYNVDVLVEDLPGVMQSELTVRVAGGLKGEVTTYLVIPSHKIFSAGGLLTGKSDMYGFYEADGKLSLPQGVQGYVIATAEQAGKLYYGAKEFTTAIKQDIEVNVLVTTKEQMNAAIKQLELGDIAIEAGKSKNADSIARIDSLLKNSAQLKPQQCDCSIFYAEHDTGFILEAEPRRR
jgi:mono/diheme cytochrome c family protein